MKKIISGLVAVLIVLGVVCGVRGLFFTDSNINVNARTYFSYSDSELATLKNVSSKYSIKPEQLYALDREIFRIVSKNNYPDTTASRVYAYLFVAERDFANLSYQMNGSYKGSLVPISKKVICLFFKDDCETIDFSKVGGSDANGDQYSEMLADIVMVRIKERIDEEALSSKEFIVPEGSEYWSASKPWIGYETAAWKPWSLTTNDEFRAQNLPFDQAIELETTLSALRNITDEQKRAVVFWAGGPGTKTPPGIWIDIADELLQRDAQTPLEKVLDVRTGTALAAADAVIGVMDSKYTYARKRPFMLDPTIRTIMPTPNHPSYPAGHSTISNAAATFLVRFFPNDAEEINSRATEAGLSRIWGGIHFSMDHTEGVVLGNNIGDKTFLRLSQDTQ